jgi:thiamine transporter ThiT
MRVSLKAITLSSAILWGLAMLFVGLIHMAEPAYGGDFLRLMSSVYPGADTAPTLGRVLIGTLYGFADGAVAGFIFGLLYDVFTGGARVLSK